MAAEEHRLDEGEEVPTLLLKLRERKLRHKQRNILVRAAIVVFGVFVIIAGVVLSAPGVPGPGFVTILLGISFIALEFDWAERLLERAIVFGDGVAERAEQTTRTQRMAAGTVVALALAAFVVAAILWDIPLVPVL
jgi:uncharacterized protein (TIGR02611 family)